ncbi:glycosyltransferase family 29 protein [Mesorhizobium sp. DCY119]|uniref:glycosyltransferase family 29 protein n=1 Tax=Mesorhizobium sp. DCY119 TaxID=2108445 RepID=UPI001FE19B1C|nr:glycosyltransferase family 29 protein [Mesorhizobium sp. DCY119]
MAKKKLFIVGNGPLLSDMSEQVDAADHVIRFNEPKASIGMSGTKTNWLFVCNTGKPMERRLKDPKYPTSPIVQAAEFVFLVSHPTAVQKYSLKPSLWARIKGRRAEWTWASLTMYGDAGKTVAILPPDNYEAGCLELGLDLSVLLDDRTFPTTGYFGIRYALERMPAETWDVEIAGFGWQGWKNHTWDQEREWVQRKAKERNIKIWPAGEDWKPKYAKKDRYSRKK